LQIGFTTLRDLTLFRIPLRQDALDTLFSLATHSSKAARNAAIVTLKRWVPENSALTAPILSFARALVQRLQVDGSSQPSATPATESRQETPSAQVKSEEDGSAPSESSPTPAPPTGTSAIVERGEIKGGLERPPTTDLQVVQHVELLLALSIKVPDLLDTCVFIILSHLLQASLYGCTGSFKHILARTAFPRRHYKTSSLLSSARWVRNTRKYSALCQTVLRVQSRSFYGSSTFLQKKAGLLRLLLSLLSRVWHKVEISARVSLFRS
jgi:hypothetical protein